MALTFKNLSGGSGTSTTTTRVYTLPLSEASWLRIAKVPNVSKNSSGVFTFDCYGVKEDGHNEVLTTSVFSVSCGLDNSGKFVSDVLPINQAPELTSSDGSGSDGVSGSGNAGGGSGETGGRAGVHGLASIKLENFEGQTYVCGLMNYPSVELYTALSVDMRIENNLNFEMLDNLEVVNLDEVIYGADQVVSEGTVIEAGKDYEFRIRCKLSDYKNVVENYAVYNDYPFDAFDIKLYYDNNVGIYINLIRLDVEEGYVDNGLSFEKYDDYLYPDLFFRINHEYISYQGSIPEDSDIDILTHISERFIKTDEHFYSNIIKISGTITLYKTETTPAYLEVNGEKVLEIEEIGNEYTYYIENLIPNKDSVILRDGIFGGNFILDLENTEIEISIPYNTNREKVISKIEIANENLLNPSIILKDVTKHETSQSYDLFSPYIKITDCVRDSKKALNIATANSRYINDINVKLLDLKLKALGKASSSYTMKIIPNDFLRDNDSIAYGNYQMAEELGTYSFAFADNLEEIHLPVCKEIGGWSFNFCHKLSKCILSNNLITIESSAFQGCTSLRQITIPKSVVNIGDRIFNGVNTIVFCEAEQPLDTWSTLWYGGYGTVYYNINDTTLVVENGTLGSGYYIKSGTTEAKFVFFDNYDINGSGTYQMKTTIKFSDETTTRSVTSIGAYAFSTVQTVYSLSAYNISHIDTKAFLDCVKLSAIYLGYEGLVTLGVDVFSGVPSGLKIHVRSAYVDLYYSDSVWSELINNEQVEIIGDYEEVVG